ncbi:MAG: hypothetical protein AAFZ07_30310, partial [Actinomycetota bacterium]
VTELIVGTGTADNRIATGAARLQVDTRAAVDPVVATGRRRHGLDQQRKAVQELEHAAVAELDIATGTGNQRIRARTAELQIAAIAAGELTVQDYYSTQEN